MQNVSGMESDEDFDDVDDMMMQELKFDSRREQRKSEKSERGSIRKSDKFTPDEEGF